MTWISVKSVWAEAENTKAKSSIILIDIFVITLDKSLDINITLLIIFTFAAAIGKFQSHNILRIYGCFRLEKIQNNSGETRKKWQEIYNSLLPKRILIVKNYQKRQRQKMD